jgi:hypothetical protein
LNQYQNLQVWAKSNTRLTLVPCEVHQGPSFQFLVKNSKKKEKKKTKKPNKSRRKEEKEKNFF